MRSSFRLARQRAARRHVTVIEKCGTAYRRPRVEYGYDSCRHDEGPRELVDRCTPKVVLFPLANIDMLGVKALQPVRAADVGCWIPCGSGRNEEGIGRFPSFASLSTRHAGALSPTAYRPITSHDNSPSNKRVPLTLTLSPFAKGARRGEGTDAAGVKATGGTSGRPGSSSRAAAPEDRSVPLLRCHVSQARPARAVPSPIHIEPKALYGPDSPAWRRSVTANFGWAAAAGFAATAWAGAPGGVVPAAGTAIFSKASSRGGSRAHGSACRPSACPAA